MKGSELEGERLTPRRSGLLVSLVEAGLHAAVRPPRPCRGRFGRLSVIIAADVADAELAHRAVAALHLSRTVHFSAVTAFFGFGHHRRHQRCGMPS